jgi:iron(III) transport system substrate-binding protein
MTYLSQAVLFGAVSIILVACGQNAGAPSGSTVAAAAASGQASANLAMYDGADRTQLLEAGARKEGHLIWYTSLIVDQLVQPLIEGFHKKYPDIQIEYFRGGSPEIVQRIQNEYKVGQHNVDVIDGSDTTGLLKKQDLLSAFNSPGLAQFPNELKDPDHMWGGLYTTYFVFGYNTKLVPSGQQPKTYEDLLDPKWKGKLAWSTQPTTGGPMFVGNTLQTMGQQAGMDYLKKLAQNNISATNASTRAVLDQVIGGEFSVNVVTALNHAYISKKAGAPVDWYEPSPFYGWFTSMGAAKTPAHPYTTLLFLDYIFSKEGQQVLSDSDYSPARSDVPVHDPALQPLNRGAKVNFFNSETLVAQQTAWNKTFQDIFVH